MKRTLIKLSGLIALAAAFIFLTGNSVNTKAFGSFGQNTNEKGNKRKPNSSKPQKEALPAKEKSPAKEKPPAEDKPRKPNQEN